MDICVSKQEGNPVLRFFVGGVIPKMAGSGSTLFQLFQEKKQAKTMKDSESPSKEKKVDIWRQLWHIWPKFSSTSRPNQEREVGKAESRQQERRYHWARSDKCPRCRRLVSRQAPHCKTILRHFEGCSSASGDRQRASQWPLGARISDFKSFREHCQLWRPSCALWRRKDWSTC